MSKKSADFKHQKNNAMHQYQLWYVETYKDVIHFDEFKKKVSKYNWLTESLINFDKDIFSHNGMDGTLNYSSVWRHEVLDNIKYHLNPKRTENIVTVFKMDRIKSLGIDRSAEFHTTFAFLYSAEEPTIKGPHKKINPIEHQYICLGPTFQSADGEYRRRFISFRQFKYIMNQFKMLVEPVVDQIIKWMNKKTMSIQMEAFFPKYLKDPKIQRAFMEKLDTDRLLIEIYAAVWLLEYKRLEDDTQENHLVAGYKEAMFANDDQKFYHEHIKQIPESQNGLFNALMEQIMPYPGKSFNPADCGQKFIPLRVKDVEDAENIKYPPWREIYIAGLVGDLVINGVSPGFPIFGDWFFISTNSPDIWDNKVSHLKLDHSMVASEIVHKLEEARKSTYQYGDKGDPIFITYQMEGMSEAIEVPIEYAEKEIILAPVTLVSLVEHVGRTFADMPNMITHNFYLKETGDLFSDEKIFAKYLFEYIYDLYSMNFHLQLIHSDLHLNNITLNLVRHFYKNVMDPKDTIPLIKNMHVVYNVSNSKEEQTIGTETYIFPHYGRYATIIDFSRGILGREQLMRDYPEHTTDQIISSQRKRLLKTIAREIPDFYEAHKNDFEALLLQNFDLAFKLLTCLDSFKLTKGMLGLIAHNENKVRVHPNTIKLLEKVNHMALNVLTIDMQKAFTRNIKEYDYPNLRIIKECFVDYTLDKFDQKAARRDDPELHIGIIDVWQVHNPLKYNTRSYEHFPPNIKFDYVEKHNIPVDKSGLKNFEKFKKYMETNPDERVQELAQELRDSKPERRGTPEPPKSSDKKSTKKLPKIDDNEFLSSSAI